MFVTKSRHDYVRIELEREISDLRQKLWEVRNDHWRLLAELGYTEREVKAHKQLIKKGGPEPG